MLVDPGELVSPRRPGYCAFDVIGLAASLGGLGALGAILAELPADFPAGIVVVQHLSPSYPSHLVEILRLRSALPVVWANAGVRILPGRVHVAPPDRHVTIGPGGTLALSDAPKVQFARLSADPLFGSMAREYRERCIGVVLTGALQDGAAGTRAIKAQGGLVLAQDRATSVACGMPDAAIATGCVDFVLPLAVIPHALIALTMSPGAAMFLAVARRPESAA